jgi:hypothetical protein
METGSPAWQPALVHPGDLVYADNGEVSQARQYIPCVVLESEGDHLVLDDRNGEPFPTPLCSIGVLPQGYRMAEGRLERITGSVVAFQEIAADEQPALAPNPGREGPITNNPVQPASVQRPWWKFWG